MKKSFQLPNLVNLPGASRIDLAPDQCTLFYADKSQVGHRFDACTGQALPDVTPQPYLALRALSGGVARDPSLTIYDASNQPVRVITPQTPTVSAMAFDPDPQLHRRNVHIIVCSSGRGRSDTPTRTPMRQSVCFSFERSHCSFRCQSGRRVKAASG